MVSDKELRKIAKTRADFKMHLFWYVAINVMLFIINMLTSRNSLWFYWVTIFWGLGVLGHWFSAYHGSKTSLEEGEYQKLKAQQKRKKRK